MNKILNEPYIIFWISIPITLLTGWLYKENTLDINIHDTYFIISILQIAYLISVLFGFIGFGYWIIIKRKGKLSKWLNAIHIIMTLGGVIGIWISSLPRRRTYLESEIPTIDGIATFNVAITILGLTIIIAQIFYWINLIMGLISKRSKTMH